MTTNPTPTLSPATAAVTSATSLASVSSAASPSGLSAQLDAVLIEFFTVFASLRAARGRLSSQLSDGFFSFSLVRHADPRLLLDSSSYSARQMRNTVAVDVNSSESGPLYTLHAVDDRQPPSPPPPPPPPPRRRLPIRQRVFTAHQSLQSNKLDAYIAQQGKLTPEVEAEIDSQLLSSSASAPPAVDLSRTPLRWFALLVPPSLQQAQRQFSSALQQTMEVAALEQRLRELETHYMRLLSEKDPHWASSVERTARQRREKSEEKEQTQSDDEEKAGKAVTGRIVQPHSAAVVAEQAVEEEAERAEKVEAAVPRRRKSGKSKRGSGSSGGVDDEVAAPLSSLSMRQTAAP